MEKESPATATVIARMDLYKQVWSTPLVQLATRYRTTKSELSTICARMNVPRPPSGYWLKKSHGKPVVQEPLPAAGPETVLETFITPAVPKLLQTPAQIEFNGQLAIARAKFAGLQVPEDIGRPHPVVEHWLAEHDRKTRENPLFKPKAFTELDHRRFRFLDTLFKAIEKIGFEIKTDEFDRAYLRFDGEQVDFTLRERQRQVHRPLEDKRYKAWSKELARTGDLVFKITTWLPRGTPIIWKDDAEKPLEWQLEDIVAVLSLVGPHLVRQRKVRAADQERRWDEQHRQYLAKQRRDQDERRWQRLLEFAHRRDQAESVRRLVADIESQPHPQGNFGGLTAVEWLEWARRWLEQFDPLMRKPQDLYEELAAVRAF